MKIILVKIQLPEQESDTFFFELLLRDFKLRGFTFFLNICQYLKNCLSTFLSFAGRSKLEDVNDR